MTRQAKWLRVSRAEPCPVCGRPDYCTRTADGNAVKCMRIESAKPIEKGGWLHKLSEPLPPRKVPPIEKKRDWTDECRRMYSHPLAFQKRQQVALQLGVSPESLDLLRVGIGWDQWNGREFSSWPSRDHTGGCIGFIRRYDDGTKRTNRGGSTGLFYCANWYRHPGPILIVEGGSDVAACETHDLCAIGRPSNVFGALWIRKMLPEGKPVVVIGERDEKPEKRGTVSQCPKNCRGCAFCWPGLFGMEKVARELKAGCFMPDAKDMRELLAASSSAEFLTELKRERTNGGTDAE